MTERLLYYKKFSKSIEDEGYDFNPYEPCVANKIIKGSPMTVCFHVDYCKLIQNIPKVVVNKITCIKKDYESILEDG